MRIAIIDSGIHAGHPHVGPVAGAIREKAPDAELYAVKVFDQRLSITIDTLLQALDWCRENAMDVINLSLGTNNQDHRAALEAAVRGNGIVVSAAAMMPGSLPGVVAVDSDEACPRDRFRYREGVFLASPFPRPIPGVPPERNLNGVSFAVANMTGFVARALDGADGLFAALRSQAEPV